MESGNRADASRTWISRGFAERRRRIWWSVIYGNFNPRRRASQRRAGDDGFASRDWHSAHLLALAIGILLLSVADAFMTVTLLAGGAVELNPVMAALVYRSAAGFAILKMTLTGSGVMFMTFTARYRFMRVVRVEAVMYAVFLGYGALLGYEFWMLRAPIDLPSL